MPLDTGTSGANPRERKKRGIDKDASAPLIKHVRNRNRSDHGTHSDSAPFCSKVLHLEFFLRPYVLSDLFANAHRVIQETLIGKYNSGMNGVLLTYTNLMFYRLSPAAVSPDECTYDNGKGGGVMTASPRSVRILNDEPEVRFTAKVEGLVFCPAIGMKLVGVVYGIIPKTCFLRVLSKFEVEIPAAQLREAGYEYDEDKLFSWRKSLSNPIGDDDDATNKKGSRPLKIGDRIQFEITKVHAYKGKFFLGGAKPTWAETGVDGLT